MQGQRNNLLAGLLVIVCIMGVIAGVVILGGGLEFFGQKTYAVRFDLESGVSGLKRGAEVHVGGVSVGTVKGVELHRDGAGLIDGILVTIAMDSSIALRQGAGPELVLPLLGSQGIINFPSLGVGPTLGPDDVLEGKIAAPGFLAQAGYGEEEKESVQVMIARFREFSENLRAMSSEVREKWPGWSDRIDSISAKLDETVARGPVISEKLEARLDQMKEVGQTVQGILDENRENAKRMVERFASVGERADDVLERLQTELVDLAKGMLENGRDALARARGAVDDVDRFIKEQRPSIRRSLANLRLGSDQLRDTLAEVRRSPWRLIYRPDLRELNYELLYDSARSYAASIGDLRATTESIEALINAGDDAQAVRGASLEELLSDLEASYANFAEAEEAFMDQLLEAAPGSE